MISYRSHIIVGAICLVLGIAIGLGIGWKLYKPELIVETPQPEQVLEDLNVVVLQRLPENVAPPIPVEIKKGAKKAGGKLERAASITIQPKPTEEGCECEEVTVDIGVVDTGEGKRIITHTDDGTILGGTDIPLEPYAKAKEIKWEVGAVVPLENPEGVGGYVSRKVGPFSVGLQAMQPSAEEGWTAMATLGLRF
jgi:hypothetical protein